METTNAFVVRVTPGGVDMLANCLARDRILIGWEGLHGLTNPDLNWSDFRAKVKDGYYAKDASLRRAGSAGGHLWRFIRELKVGDLVVVPAPAGLFYVARVTGPAEEGLEPPVGYWRPVEWLNGGEGISRRIAHAQLQSRMKVQGSTANAGDLVHLIKQVVQDGEAVRAGAAAPTLRGDIMNRMVEVALNELRDGRIENYGFEAVVAEVLASFPGVIPPQITDRRQDMGDDIVATVKVLDHFELTVVAQVKHHRDISRPTAAAVLDELLSGMEKNNAQLGILATVGVASDALKAAVQKVSDEGGTRIVLLEGQDIAELYVRRVAPGAGSATA